MNISQLLQLEKKKTQLQKKKHSLIQKALIKKKKQQINADQQSIKKGYIEKTKIIKKKQYQTVHQKARNQTPVEIQQNASVSSYLINNGGYNKIYQRTKKIIQFDDQEKLSMLITALKAYAQEHFQKILHMKLIFEKQIDCGKVIRPFQLQLPTKLPVLLHKQYPIPKAIILVKNVKALEKSPTYKNLTSFPIEIKQYSQFIKQWKNDKDFKKKFTANRILILCDWEIYKNSTRIVEGLLEKGYIVFPFDVKKVPYFVNEKYPNISYEGYLKLMLENEYALIKSGKQHSIHLKLSKQQSVQALVQNIKQSVIEMVSKLIERNKDKSGNNLCKLQVKTNTSINFVLYQKK